MKLDFRPDISSEVEGGGGIWSNNHLRSRLTHYQLN
jgi:hypothetical protein